MYVIFDNTNSITPQANDNILRAHSLDEFGQKRIINPLKHSVAQIPIIVMVLVFHLN